MNNIGYFNLFKFSLKVGIDAVRKGIFTKESIKRIICPLDVSRYYELPVVANRLALKSGKKILDISSPKLLTYYLANKYKKVSFFGIDKFREELDAWQEIVKSPNNLTIEYGDATKLKYPSNCFDEIYSVSVIEHLGDKNKRDDSKMIREVYRVLKKGGKFYMTTIISRKADIIYKGKKLYEKGKITQAKNFFCRVYSYNELTRKVLKIVRFKPMYEEICNYTLPSYERVFNILSPFSILMGWLNLLIAPLSINTTKNVHNIQERAEYFCILKK